ncbi:MAG: enoyl-CoA hydratase, partial [Acetobacteraceae bacterium]
YNGWQRAVATALQTSVKPIVAAVHGYCLGAGFEFALMSDFRLCAADTRMGIPAVRLGLPYRLEDIEKVVAVVGLARAREMVLLGRQYGGEELLSLGVATQMLLDIPALDAAVDALAKQLVENAPLSLKAAKVAFRALIDGDGSPEFEHVKALEDACYASADYAEGRQAKTEKRAPVFMGY